MIKVQDNKLIRWENEHSSLLCEFDFPIDEILETEFGVVVILKATGKTGPHNMFLFDLNLGKVKWQAAAAPNPYGPGSNLYGLARIKDGKLIAWTQAGLEFEIDWATGKPGKIVGFTK